MNRRTYISLLFIAAFFIIGTTKACSEKRETIYVCEGKVAQYNGRNYTAGTYTVRQTGEEDIILTVIPSPHYSYPKSDSIYKGESFVYKGHRRSFNSVGTFSWADSLLTIHGCDSIINHTLTVRPRPTTYANFDTHICAGDSVFVAGRWYKTSGSNSITIRGGNYLKGDSVITFRVYVHKAETVTYYATIRQGETKQWYFHKCSTLPAGTHKLTSANILHTIYGCDSTEVLYLTVLPRTYGTDTLHICEGEETLYNNKIYNKTGVYTEQLTNKAGGDSLLTLTVLIHPKYNIVMEDSVDYGIPYVIGDTTYNNLTPGTYNIRRETTSRFGCDSIINATLEVTKAQQTIILHTNLPDTLYLRQRIKLTTEASSGLPVMYETDNTLTLEITEDNEIRAIAPGYATLTINQSGNEFYLPAAPIRKHFVIVRSTDMEQTDESAKTAARKELINGRIIITVKNIKTDILGQTVNVQ